MPKHNVHFQLPKREMGKEDAHFYIYRDEEKLGQITISKGGLDYYPHRKKYPIKVSWTQLDQVLRSLNEENV